MVRIIEIRNDHFRNPRSGEYEVGFVDELTGYKERLPLDHFLYKMGVVGTVETAKLEVISILQSGDVNRMQTLCNQLDIRYKNELAKKRNTSYQQQLYYNSPYLSRSPYDSYPHMTNVAPIKTYKELKESIIVESSKKRNKEIYYLLS